MPRIQSYARRAFALSPVIIFLFLIYLAVCATYGWVLYDRLSAAPPQGITAGGLQISVILGVVFGMALFLVITCVITLVIYFIFGKSDGAANLTLALLLLLAIAGTGFSTYGTANAPPPSKQIASNQKAEASHEKFLQDFAAQNEVMEQQRQQQLDAMRGRSTSGQPNPSPSPPSPTYQPAPTPGTASPTPSSPSQSRPVPTPPKADDPTVKRVTDDLTADVNKQIDDLLAAAPPLLATLGKVPARDIRDLRKRVDDVSALRETAAALGKRLHDLGEEAQKKLEMGGTSNAMGQGMSFANRFSAMPRSFACDRLVRLLDHAKEEAEVLRDNIGKWTIGKDGKVSSKDSSVHSKAQSARFFLDSELGQKDQILDGIKGR